MPNETVAGSIVVQLKAQIEDLKKGVAEAKTVLQGLGKGVQDAAQQVNQGGTRIGRTFDDIDKRSIRLAARTALLTNRLLGLQLILQTIGTRFAGSKFSREMQTATDALTAFGGVVSIFPNKIGLAVGGIAALAAVIGSLVQPTAKEREELERVTKLLQNLDEARKKIESGRKLADQDFSRRRRLGVVDDPNDPFEKENKDLEKLIKDRESLLDELALVTAKLDARVLELAGPDLTADERNKLIDDINRLEDKVKNLNEVISEGQLAKAFRDINKEMKEFTAEMAQGAKNADILIQHGLISPLQALQLEVSATEAKLRKAFEFQATLNGIKPGSGDALNTVIGEGLTKLKTDREQLARGLEVDRLATNFSSAIGQGIIDGIMAGESAMEVLANVSKNLFENALRDVVGNFQTGMTEAFKAITGVAGVEIGGLITGLVGIAAGIFNNRKNKSSSSFDNVRSNIESSQAVRGVVAGPTNVAIASVGEDIGRAMAPVVQRLDIIARFSLEIARNTRGGLAAAGGGGADFVQIPTA